jgi:hypothetical protein
VQSYFLHERNLTGTGTDVTLNPDAEQILNGILEDFQHAFRAPRRSTTIARSA